METNNDLTTAAANLRAQLKALGYSSRQVNVRAKDLGTDEAIEITIKHFSVDVLAVQKIAEQYEVIDRDPVTGEILSGGNRYAPVRVASEVFTKAELLFAHLVNNSPDRCAIYRGVGVWWNGGQSWTITGPQFTRAQTVGPAELAVTAARALLGGMMV